MKGHCIAAFLVWLAISAQVYESKAQYTFRQMVWSDEFNTPGLPDTTKWSYDTGNGCPNNCGWGNNELQYYTQQRMENARVENGCLIIEARIENFQEASYTSARLVTRQKAQWQYGRIEVRARIPDVRGSWPAIWMLGHNIGTVGWPACGEIDIMEHVGHRVNKIYGTLHYPGFSGDNAVGGTVLVNNVAAQFHTYTVEWTAQSIRFFVDDKEYFKADNTPLMPYHHPFYLILNVAVGGNFGGKVDEKFRTAKMEVDYVRVYQ